MLLVDSALSLTLGLCSALFIACDQKISKSIEVVQNRLFLREFRALRRYRSA